MTFDDNGHVNVVMADNCYDDDDDDGRSSLNEIGR